MFPPTVKLLPLIVTVSFPSGRPESGAIEEMEKDYYGAAMSYLYDYRP